MKLFNEIKTELYKNIISRTFLVCVLSTALLCFTTGVTVSSGSKSIYTVWSLLISGDRTLMLNEISLMNLLVMSAGMGKYLLMFFPILGAMPSVRSICISQRTRYIRMEILRAGRKNYIWGKFIAGVLCGALVSFLGYSIYSLIVLVSFPGIREYHLDDFILNFLGIKNGFIWVSEHLLGAALYGMISSSMALVCCSFMNNEYLILCCPFLVSYIWTVLLTKLISDGIIGERVFSILNLNELIKVFVYDDMFYRLSFHLGILVIGFVIYSFFMNRKCRGI